MERIEEIKKRNERHKQLRDFHRSPAVDVSSNKELDMHVFEIKHITDKTTEDIECLLSLIDTQKKEIERYRNIFEKMTKGDVWMTFDMDPVEAYKEYANHALNNKIPPPL